MCSALLVLSGSTRLEFGKASDLGHMTSPREIDEELCIETNFSATDFIKRIKNFFSYAVWLTIVSQLYMKEELERLLQIVHRRLVVLPVKLNSMLICRIR